MNIINIYLITINIIAFILMAIDKVLAIHHKNRLSEFSLLTTSFIGGSIGIILGMLICKHKIRKIKFLILVPLSLIITIFIYIKIPLV